MRDTAYVSAAAGLAGAAVVDGLTFLYRLFGIHTRTPWGVAAEVFLRPGLARSPAGVVLGLIVSAGLSIAAAFLICLLLRLTGRDYAVLKGVLVAETFGFVSLGLLAPLLGIAQGLKNDPVTYYVALVNLAALGAVQGWLAARLLGRERNPARAG